MSIATVVAALAALLSAYVGALSLRFSRAPGWSDQRWFALAAFTASAYSALNVPVLLPGTCTGTILLLVRVQLLLAGLHVTAWTRYACAYLEVPVGWLERVIAAVALGVGLVAQIPGAVYQDELHLRAFAPLGVVYRDPVTNWFGDLAVLAFGACFVPVLVRFAQGARRGVPHATTHAVAIAALLCLAVNDALAVAGIVGTPYLLDLAYVLPVGVVGYALTARFAADARDLKRMRNHLEVLVVERTEQLGRAQEALHRSEKLASLGQLAAGVAHEVANPAAVISANLGYLEQRLIAGQAIPDELECVREAAVALQRVSSITRQLLQAGQLSAGNQAGDVVSIAQVVRDAVATARARTPGQVSLVADVPEGLRAMGNHETLHQVLVNLILNGAQAVPAARGGRVTVAAERGGGQVRVTVVDDGEGMPPDVLRRVFEPFFTTKPFGSGTGLGLAVSRGLVSSLGGELRLESEVGRGTRAVLELIEAAGSGPAQALGA